MKSITLIFILSLFTFCASAGTTIYCSHAELCKMVRVIAAENKIADIKTETLVNISGDPHEYEPSTTEIKNLLNAPLLLSGPNELNPWIKKINFKRSKSAETKTISLVLESRDYNLYDKASAEALSHFWLYPKIYCSLKSKLESELMKLKLNIKNPKVCDSKKAEQELQTALAKINLPIILTHDALLPLMNSLDESDGEKIVAIKGSSHHEEVNPKAVKKMYDSLNSPRVIWVREAGISIPPNILNKIRANDHVISLNSDKTLEDPFSVISELTAKLNQLPRK